MNIIRGANSPFFVFDGLYNMGLNSSSSLDFFFIRHQGKFVKISFGDILYVASSGNYCKIVLDTGNFMVLGSLKLFNDVLPPSRFCRIHRAHIISLERLTAFDHKSVYLSGLKMPIGEEFRKNLAFQTVQSH